jgi:hypothetical protein
VRVESVTQAQGRLTVGAWSKGASQLNVGRLRSTANTARAGITTLATSRAVRGSVTRVLPRHSSLTQRASP